MKQMIPALTLLAGALWQSSAAAQDDLVTTRTGKPKNFTIKQESPRGITYVAGKNKDGLIPAEDIVDVRYKISSTTTKVEKYTPAINKEMEAADKKKQGKRALLLAEAIQLYRELGEALTDADGPAKRHVDFKIALLTAHLAEADGKELTKKKAVLKLTEFKRKYPQSWQLVECLKTLAQLQVSLHLYGEAEETFRALAAAPVNENLKQFARLQAVQVFVKAGRLAQTGGKVAEARKYFTSAADQLKTLAQSIPPTRQVDRQRTQLVRAEMLTELDQYKEAQEVTKQILKETNDKQVKAGAYNTMGYIYYRTKKLKDASWEFLWVDVIYNQDREEHAKALYYLSEIWAALGEGDRARECLDQLLTDRNYEGLPYQQRAAQEELERNKKQE